MKNILILIISIIFFFDQSAFAEEVSPMQMDFFHIVKYSLDHNKNLSAIRHNLSATEKEIGIARSELLPKVKFIEGFDATNNPTNALTLKLNQARAVADDFSIATINRPPSVTNFLTAGIVEQSIYNKKSVIAVKMAKKAYTSNGYFYLRKQEDLVNQISQACIEILRYKELIDATELGIRDTKDHLKMAEERNKKKSGIYSDVLRAKTAVEEMEQKQISNKRNLNVVKKKLGLLLGVENSIEILDSVPEINLRNIEYYKEASQSRKDIKALELRVENAKTNIKSAQADWYPTISAIGSYNFYNNEYPFGSTNSSYIAGAFLKWDAFGGNKRKYEILKAKEKEAAEKENLEELKLTVNYEIYEVYSTVEELQKELELSVAQQKAAEEDEKLVTNRWQNSLLPFVSLVDAQANLDDARARVVNRRNDLKEAIINLSFESGIIAQDLQLK